jgi:hypothetical protein
MVDGNGSGEAHGDAIFWSKGLALNNRYHSESTTIQPFRLNSAHINICTINNSKLGFQHSIPYLLSGRKKSKMGDKKDNSIV